MRFSAFFAVIELSCASTVVLCDLARAELPRTLLWETRAASQVDALERDLLAASREGLQLVNLGACQS
ncbi:hypothetical protein A4G26_26080 [Mycobacterium kansasii]|nr:hypothetical protein A4G26_26080 [Mycobacterium kansasii]